MTWAYLLILIFSLSFPLLKSFGKPLYFSRNFHALFPAIFVMAVIFLIWDVYFTHLGNWGFNPMYISGIYIVNLPIEEVLFFLIIPYCCMFIYEVVRLRQLPLTKKLDQSWIHIGSMIVLLLVFVSNLTKEYTRTASLYALLVLFFTWAFKKDMLPLFYLSFLYMLIPFLAVNGILTGSFIPDQIVWYNDEENLGIRLFTIPLDDFIYCLGMMLTVAVVYEILLDRKASRSKPLSETP